MGRRNFRQKGWLIVLFLSLFSSSLASSQPLFGPEFELTNEKIRNAEDSEAMNSQAAMEAIQLMAKKMKEKCPKRLPSCIVFPYVNKQGVEVWKIRYNYQEHFVPEEQMEIVLNVDPATVEIQTSPQTVAGFKKWKKVLQEDIFDLGKSVGLQVDRVQGAGHIHLGLQETFQNDALLFRNFLVDLINRPGMTLGALGLDPWNAPPLALFSSSPKKKLAEVLQQFDKHPEKMSLVDFAKRIHEEVYQETFQKNWSPIKKYQAVNLSRIFDPFLSEEQKTIELRFLRSQRNMEEFIRLITLFEKRIEMLKKIRQPIPLQGDQLEKFKLGNFLLEGEAPDPRRSVEEFHHYVVGAGLAWEDYQPLLPGALRALEPLSLEMSCSQ